MIGIFFSLETSGDNSNDFVIRSYQIEWKFFVYLFFFLVAGNNAVDFCVAIATNQILRESKQLI